MMLRVSRHVKGKLPIFLSTDSTVVHSSGIASIDAASEPSSPKMTGPSGRDDNYTRISLKTGCFPNRSGVGIVSLRSRSSRAWARRWDALACASQHTYESGSL